MKVLYGNKAKSINPGMVPVTVFKNLSMLRWDTNDHPIFIGPKTRRLTTAFSLTTSAEPWTIHVVHLPSAVTTKRH